MGNLSLVTAGFNRRDLLSATLNSVAAQGPALLECLAADGGSTDGSFALIRAAAARQDRIKPVIASSVSAAMRQGLFQARGTVLAVMPPGLCFANSRAAGQMARAFDQNPDADAMVCFAGVEGALPQAELSAEALRDRYCQARVPAAPVVFFRRSALDHLDFIDNDCDDIISHLVLMRLAASGARLCDLPGIISEGAPARPLADTGLRPLAKAVRLIYGFLSVEWRERLNERDVRRNAPALRAEAAKALSLGHRPAGQRSAAAISEHGDWRAATVMAFDDKQFTAGLASIARTYQAEAPPGPILVYDNGLTPHQRASIHGLCGTYVIDTPTLPGAAGDMPVSYEDHACLVVGAGVTVVRVPIDPAPDLAGLRFEAPPQRRLVVLGNGPSLKGFDFARLAPFDTIGLNVAFRYWDEIGWYPTHYVCLDEIVGLSHAADIARLIRRADRYGIRRFLLRRNLIHELGTASWNERVFDFDLLYRHHPAFSREPLTTGSHALIWGAALGYRDIALLGVDGAYVERVVGAESRGGVVLEITKATENPNYFFAGYQQPGDRYNLPNANLGGDLHIDSWRAAALSAAEYGARVRNANPASSVDAFERTTFEAWAANRLDPAGMRQNAGGPSITVPHLPFSRDSRVQFDEDVFTQAIDAQSRVGAVFVQFDADRPGQGPDLRAEPLLARGLQIYRAEFYPRLAEAPRHSFRQLRPYHPEPPAPGSWGFLIGLSALPSPEAVHQALIQAVDHKPVWP